MTFLSLRITHHISGTHIWEIGEHRTFEAARAARNAALEDDAAHWTHHSGPGGYVGVAPIPEGVGLTLHAADGTVEHESIFTVGLR
jgi:hypothetical protein